MSIWSSVFKGLKLTSDQLFNGAPSSMASLGASTMLNLTNYHRVGGRLVFRSNGLNPTQLVAYAAKRTMMQMAFARLNDLYPKYLRELDTMKAKAAYEKNQGRVKQKLIQNGKRTDASYNGVSLTYRGAVFHEALVMWIKGDSDGNSTISINSYWDKVKGLSNVDSHVRAGLNEDKYINVYESTKLSVPTTQTDNVFWDLGATVQTQGGNSVVLTRVVGRDYSRKELVSGGDLKFTVTGKIASNYPDVYPTEEVQRFIRLMQYKGIIQVYHLMFQQFKVTQVMIQDFQMGEDEGFKNIQPYSFTCVAVEPDENTRIVTDTIETTNLQIRSMKKNGWSKTLLENVKKSAANQAAQLMEQLISDTI